MRSALFYRVPVFIYLFGFASGYKEHYQDCQPEEERNGNKDFMEITTKSSCLE